MELKLKYLKFITSSILVMKNVDGRMFDVALNCPASSSFLVRYYVEEGRVGGDGRCGGVKSGAERSK